MEINKLLCVVNLPVLPPYPYGVLHNYYQKGLWMAFCPSGSILWNRREEWDLYLLAELSTCPKQLQGCFCRTGVRIPRA